MTNSTGSTAPATVYKLVVIAGHAPEPSFTLTGSPVTIGRELYNTVPLNDPHISHEHARITQPHGRFLIEDLNSVNGTQVNGVSISGPYPLQPGDIISLGNFSFRLDEEIIALPQAKTGLPAGGRAADSRSIWIAGGAVALLLLGLIVLVAGLWFAWRFRNSTAVAPPSPTLQVNGPVIVINQGPAGSLVRVNQTVTMQVTATDPTGMDRLELWVNNRPVDEVVTQLAQNVPSVTAAFRWKPDVAGNFALEIRAYNQSGLVSRLSLAAVTVVKETETPAPVAPNTPTPTQTPAPPPLATPTAIPTATPAPTPAPSSPTPSPPTLTVNVPVLNVRAGPGVAYPITGELLQGDQVEITGQAVGADGPWWQIRLDPLPEGRGWVSANPAFSAVQNTGDVPAVVAPPLPTPPPPAAPSPTASAIPTAPALRAPEGKTLLIVSNRSLTNQPARLTLSGGKSVGGGREIDPAPGREVQLVLEPDYYRALWSASYRGFVRGADFTAVPGKIVVMWIVPEDGVTNTEVYDELQ
jgi:hypothetical protein